MGRARDPYSMRACIVAYHREDEPRRACDILLSMFFDNVWLPQRNFYATLSQLTKRGDLIRVARGVYVKAPASRQEAA